MLITELKVKRGHLYEVVFGERSVPIDRDVADTRLLKAGVDISPEDFEKIYSESQFARAKSRCLWYLERRDYTAKELSRKLYGKFEPEYIEMAVERMKELGLVNDSAYAFRKAEIMIGEQGMSMRAARQKLMQNGVDRSIIEDALGNIEYDAVAAALELIKKKYASKLDSPDDIRRTYGALLRRGFNHTDIKQAFKQLKEDLEFEE